MNCKKVIRVINPLRLAFGLSGGEIALLLRLALLVFALHICGQNLQALKLPVALDGSQEYTVIQEAIDASADGDTVLVYPGRYIENLRFNGKNITLASLELISGDREYIYSTIIDGNQSGAVVTIYNGESNIQIRGFTITNGSGRYIEDYDMSVGGGLIVSRMTGEKTATIVNCDISGNNANDGGGFWGGTCNLHFSGVSIHDNIASTGGGMKFEGAISLPWSINFDADNRCSIYRNLAAFGSDLYFYKVDFVHVVVDTFTVANPWNFYATAIPGNPNITNPYTFDILNTVHTEVNHDLYVAPWGDDSNSGISPDQPMKSIFMAMYNIASDSENPKTVHVANGHYSPSLNGQLFPIPIKSYTRLAGESREGTVLDAEYEAILMKIPAGSISWSAENICFKNGKGGLGINRAADFLLLNLAIDSVSGINYPLGIACVDAFESSLSDIFINNVTSPNQAAGYSSLQASGRLSLENVEITNCSAVYMKAIEISAKNECDIFINGVEVHGNRSTSSDAFGFNSMFQISPYDDYSTRLRIEMKNSAFYDNYQSNGNHMSMARAFNDTLFISNCTFAGNTGGGVPLCVQGTSVLTNNILHNPNSVYQILVPNYTSSGIFSSLTLYYNNILGGYSGVISQSEQNPVWWLTGNSDVDPLFVGEGNRPYLLSPLSPLIDSGRHPVSGVIDNSRDAAGNERYWDGDGDGISTIDVGAYEYQPISYPISLEASVWQNQIQLAWQMQINERGLSGFRIYRDGEAYEDIMEPSQYEFRDYSAQSDSIYYYVVALYGSVESAPSNTVEVIIEPVANADEMVLPLLNTLSIGPNPFRDIAVIQYQLEKQSEVELKIYNLKGQLIRTLPQGVQNKGNQVLAWDGSDDRMQAVASGLYFIRMLADGKIITTRKILKI
jgi:hypothetical protein